MQVSYSSNSRKTNFTEAETSNQPKVSITAPNGPFTLVMVDPDAGDKTPGLYYLHWLVVNIPPGGNLQEATTVVDYRGPTPPAGTGQHHYHFILYQQTKGNLINGLSVRDRPNWSLDSFLSGKYLTEVARQTIRVPPLKLNAMQ